MTTCGGSLVAINKATGVRVAENRFPEMIIGRGPINGRVSKDQKIFSLEFGECTKDPGTNRWVFDNNSDFVEYSTRTVHLAIDKTAESVDGAVFNSTAAAISESQSNLPGLAPGTEQDLSKIKGGFPRKDVYLEAAFLDGETVLAFDGAESLCAFTKASGRRLWCHTINPVPGVMAGPGLGVDLYKTGSDYLVVTSYRGLFLLEGKTGYAKWVHPFLAIDASARVFDLGDRLLLVPLQHWN